MITLLHGDCRDVLTTLPERSVQACVTSPPYFSLRSYLPAEHPDKAREIGQEPLPDCLAWARGDAPCGACYVCTMRAVFALVWRVLRDDGVLWLNLGDSYNAYNGNRGPATGANKNHHKVMPQFPRGYGRTVKTLGNKQLIGIPWRVALALQADGWYLRSDTIWAKSNPMPESVRGRPTKAHEYVFLFAKQERYFYDAVAVAENALAVGRIPGGNKKIDTSRNDANRDMSIPVASTRNLRSVWHIPTQPTPHAHFAAYPEKLVEICVLAGTSPQACAVCGAPWARVVEREGRGPGALTPKDEALVQAGARGRSGVLHGPGWRKEPPVQHVSLGFRSICPHDDGSGRCVVLDPFCGSGTTAKVAERLGRDSIGIELNADYITIAEQRTDGLQLTLTEVL